jgi:hypothetical protein
VIDVNKVTFLIHSDRYTGGIKHNYSSLYYGVRNTVKQG